MFNKYRLKFVAFCAAGTALAFSPLVQAGEPSKPAKSVVEEVKKSCISGSLGVALTNEYIARGLVQDKDTLIAQPYLNLSFKLYEGDGCLNSISFNVPFWWSINDTNKPTPIGNPTGLRDWYEFDWGAGFTFVMAKKWTAAIDFLQLTSPGDYFNTTNNLKLTVSYDDTDLLGAFALHPYFLFMQELSGHSGLGAKGGASGQYYVIGLAPRYTLEKDSSYPLTFTIPATVGLGSNGYYGQGFGYFSIGGTVSVPLAFIPSCYGNWTSSLSGLWYYLGTNASSTDNPDTPGLNITNGGAAPGRRNQGVVSWSIGMTF